MASRLPRIIKTPTTAFRVLSKTFDDPNQLGEIDWEADKIYIRKGLRSSQRWKAFFHELLHVVEYDVGLDLDDEGHSGAINRLALGLYAIFLANNWSLPSDETQTSEG